jgi:NAD(P)-dependent dehydrogenase (short-subunit alcohol dehydrogenase family)
MSTTEAVAVITGASQGIGAALVQAFRSRGYRVVATSRSIKPSADPDIVTVQGDVADPKTSNLVFKEAWDRFGRIDTLVNNAGMFMAKPFTAYSNEDYAAYLATNVTGFFHMTQRAMELMSQRGCGHVVTVSTSLVDQPMTSVPAVLASLTKGGLNAATKSLAIEYARKGVRVNAVSAGIINTPMHPPEAHQMLASLHPMGRMGKVSDIVDAIMYLESAGFVTGEILHVDGGQAAGHHAIS